MKYLDRIANIAIIVAVIVFLGLVIRGQIGWRHSAPEPPSAQNLIGTQVSLAGLELPKDRNSLVLVVSTQCHFCRESLPFYKQLSEQAKGRMMLVAVLPQPEPEGAKFLQDAGVRVDRVISASPGSLGVRGTPTVMLVDGNAKVKQAWVGELDAQGQQKLLALALPGGAP